MTRQINPKWPTVDYAISWATGRTSTQSPDYWCSLSGRTEGKVDVQRGKIYELDQAQPGAATLTVRNDDGAFDPGNPSSPYAGYLLPYRLLRIRAQWPPTPNLLTNAQANGGIIASGTPYLIYPYGTLAAHTTLNIAGYLPVGWYCNYQNVGSFSVAPAIGTGARVSGFSVEGGTTYTASSLASFDQAISGQALTIALQFVDPSGTVLSTVTSAPVSGQFDLALAVTATAPAGACGGNILIQLAGGSFPADASSGNFAFFLLQLEAGSVASNWQSPNWFPIFAGWTEKYSQTWTSGGNYGATTITASDSFSWFGSIDLNYPAYADMLALGPTWFYPCDDTTNAAGLADLAGQRLPATVATPTRQTVNTLALGQSLSSDNGQEPPIGIPGPVVSVAAVTGATASQAIDLSGGGKNPAGPQSSTWTRVFSFQAHQDPAVASTSQTISQIYGKGANECALLTQLLYDSSGNATRLTVLAISSGTWASAQVTLGASALTGQWHQVTVAYLGETNTTLGYYAMNIYLDGQPLTVTYGSPTVGNLASTVPFTTPSFPLTGGTDTLGAPAIGPTPGAAIDLAYAAELPFPVTPAQAGALWSSFNFAWSQRVPGTGAPATAETSGSRYQRILNWINYGGPVRIDTGNLGSYGGAVDIQGGLNPTAALPALQAVVDSEVGQHFVAADGTVTFQARGDRWNTTPTVTLGELSGEVPYTSAQIDLDPTRIANHITATAADTANTAATKAVATDVTSSDDYGTITLQRTINTVAATDLLGAAQYLCYQNAQPHRRLEALPVDVAANFAWWATILGLDLGACVQVNRRPSGAPPTNLVGFLEQIQWSFSDDGKVTWSAQVSSAELHQFGVLDSATYGLLDSTAILAY